MPAVGTSPSRREGPDKLCGLLKYLDDLPLPEAWHGVTFRSSVPHARIKSLTFDPGFPWDECVVVTAKDIPGKNLVALIVDDQPLLADGVTRHPMEPIALVAHPRREKAYEALKHIHAEYEPLPAALTIDESLAKKAVLCGEDNVQKGYLIEKGDVDAAFARADVVVEGTYKVGHQEQAYIENNAVAAWVAEDGTLTVTGSLQCPYYIHKALKKAFDLPGEKVRVIQAPTGGGFGGKEEYPSMIAGHAALLAWKAKRPVKIVYDRHEDMAATTKRHPAVVRHRTGLTRDGRIVAQDIDVVMDGGAYVTLTPVVLSRGTLHAAGAYEVDHVRVRSRAVATHTPPNGAFRGFGAPQTVFAVELHMDRCAAALGMDPLELRRKNLFKEGSVTATGQLLKESVGASECLERVAKMSGWAKRRAEYARFNKRPNEKVWKGVGLAVCHHGAGFTGSGEVYLASKAGIELRKDGTFHVLAANTEIGQGASTMFSQVAADALGVPFDWVKTEVPDTRKVPDSGPTVASRTTMVVGGIVARAAKELRALIEKEAGRLPKDAAAMRKLAEKFCGDRPERRVVAQYEPPPTVKWDDATYKGDAYAVYSYGAVAVDLEVDRTTYEVRVVKLWTAQDIGKAVHPLFAEGQIIGGTAQGLGWALLEHCVYKDGVMQNALLTNYIIPTSMDMPPVEVQIVEKPYSGGPFGAKGVGELPMDIPAPAVAAAVWQAAGVLIPELPILPETVSRALMEQAAEEAR